MHFRQNPKKERKGKGRKSALRCTHIHTLTHISREKKITVGECVTWREKKASIEQKSVFPGWKSIKMNF